MTELKSANKLRVEKSLISSIMKTKKTIKDRKDN